MKKNIILLLAAAAALGAVLFYQSSLKTKSGAASYFLDESKKASVDAIMVVKQADTAEAFLKNGEWVTSDKDWPADTSKVNKVLDVMFKLQDRETASRSPARLQEYGLDSASAKCVSLYQGGKLIAAAFLGKTSSVDYNSTFWSREQAGTVYRTPGNFGYGIDANKENWKEKGLYFFDKDQIQTMRVMWKDSTGALTAFTVASGGDDLWLLSEPKSGHAKRNHVDPMVNRFKQIKIDKFLDEGESPRQDAPPDIEIEVTLKDGKTHKLSAQKSGDFFYLQHPSRSEIVKINDWRLKVFQKSVDDIYEMPDTTSAAEPAE